MITVLHNRELNTLVIEFHGHVDVAQAEKAYLETAHIVPEDAKGLTVLTDMTELEKMDLDVQDAIARSMTLLNSRGITRVIRVIPDPTKEIGFNILSVFHYSKNVKILSLSSRAEAEERLRKH